MSEVKREHLDAARAVLKRQFGNWTEDVPLVAQALADLEAATEARAVAPFVALMLWERDNYRSVVVEKTGLTEFVLGWADENDNGGSASGATATEAARNLCAKLGLELSPPPPEAKDPTDGE